MLELLILKVYKITISKNLQKKHCNATLNCS